MIRLLICGDRDWTDADIIQDALQYIVDFYGGVSVVIEGEAPGADILAKDVAKHFGIPIDPYPANWDQLGPAAGPIRNSDMLKHGKPDVGLAFHPNLAFSTGTQDMINKMRRADMDIWLHDGKELTKIQSKQPKLW